MNTIKYRNFPAYNTLYFNKIFVITIFVLLNCLCCLSSSQAAECFNTNSSMNIEDVTHIGTIQTSGVDTYRWADWTKSEFQTYINAINTLKNSPDSYYKEAAVQEIMNSAIVTLQCYQNLSGNLQNSVKKTAKPNIPTESNKTPRKSGKQIKNEYAEQYASRANNITSEEERKNSEKGQQKLFILPDTPCISVRKIAGGNVDNVIQWVTFSNSCPFDIRVHFCTKQNCTQSTQADVLHTGDSERYPAPLYNKRYHITILSACKLKSGTSEDGQGGEGEVFRDLNGGCFAYIKN